MNQEEYDSIMDAADRLNDGVNNWKKLCEDFTERLKKELIALSVDYFPELDSCRDKWVEQLSPEIEHCSENILDGYEQIANSGGDHDKLTEIFPVPKPTTKEDDEKFLQSELNKYPEKYYPEIIKWHKGTSAEERFYNEFLHLVHNKMKEVLYSFFPDIVDFTGNQLRAIDGDIYLMGAELYKDGFLYITREYIVERFEY